jgi:hypothetical protein
MWQRRLLINLFIVPNKGIYHLIQISTSQMSLQYTKLQVPSFDLTWLKVNDRFILLAPGGGGATKSGLKNVLQIYDLIDGQMVINNTQETIFKDSSRFCFQLTTSIIKVSTNIYTFFQL